MEENNDLKIAEINANVGKIEFMNQCEHCDQEFKYLFMKTAHVKKVHEKVKIENLKCDFCNATYKAQYNLVSHIERNHQAKTLSCNMCDYTTKVTRNLKRHKNMIHTNDKRYGCDICEKQFKDCWYERISRFLIIFKVSGV